MNPFEVYVIIAIVIAVITWGVLVVHTAREGDFFETMIFGVMVGSLIAGVVGFAWPLFLIGAGVYLVAST
ncbi:membrane protein [Mycobacterium phage Delylah]|nr:membrane protein [Mycobacterium phage Delylah]WMI34162.1 hypothetical protein SEA_CARAVAN_6 [Mycobacterium phage Caravan]